MVHRILTHCLLWFALLHLTEAMAHQLSMSALNSVVQGVVTATAPCDEGETKMCFDIENGQTCSESAYETLMLPAYQAEERLDTSNPENTRLPPQQASDDGSLRLPSETEDDQSSMQGHEPAFGAELRKGSNRPDSGAPSLQHNGIPFTESAAEDDACLKVDDSSEASGEFQAPAAATTTVRELVGDNFENIDSESHLLSILAKGSGRPGTGGSSKNHN